MNVEAMSIGVEQPQMIEPMDVGLRHVGRITSIGSKRCIAAFRQPVQHFRSVAQRIHHHGIVVALQHHERKPVADTGQQPLDHTAARRPLVDVVAYRDDGVLFPLDRAAISARPWSKRSSRPWMSGMTKVWLMANAALVGFDVGTGVLRMPARRQHPGNLLVTQGLASSAAVNCQGPELKIFTNYRCN